MLKAALPDSAGWIWPPILLGSLAALLMLSRAGSSLFWRIRGDNDEPVRVQLAQHLAVWILVLALVALVIWAGWLTSFMQQAAVDMLNGLDLQQLLAPAGGHHAE